MEYLWIASVGCLYVTGLLCIAGAIAPREIYDDNLGQRIALAVLCAGCFSRGTDIWFTHVVVRDWFMVHGGLALFAVSTALKAARKS